MRKFWKDYVELCKATGRFYKEHWLGCIVLNVTIVAGEFAWFFRDVIKDNIKDKLTSKSVKENEEESE